ncbi:hypothetical protein ACISU4_10830 [Streptomyces wuyuanensis]|uniref:hypothetical protein n=1 Tax=Streptomyces wuyuanensis TaxID=1196353 RepID=UPI0038114171
MAAAGIATVTGGTTLVSGRTVAAGPDDGKAGAYQAQAAPARGGESGEQDGEYWAEHAGSPGERDGGREEGHPGPHGEGDAGTHDKDHSDARDQGRSDDEEKDDSVARGEDDSGAWGEEAGGRDEGDDAYTHDRGDSADGGRDTVPCDPNALITAVTEANNDGGGTLSLAEDCTYTLTATQDGNGLPEIVQPITIHGNGATIARAANAASFRFFQVAAGGDLHLKHLTLTRGKVGANTNGGAIFVEFAGRLDLDKVTLSHNTAGNDGGAVRNEGITRISQSTLNHNTALRLGGAISNGVSQGNGAKLNISTSKLTHNNASGGGGGIYSTGTATISKSLISHNKDRGPGGGIAVLGGVMEVEQSAISHNTGDNAGGGIFSGLASVYLRKTTVSHNTSSTGGGLYLINATVEDSKIDKNIALIDNGGGVYVGGFKVAIRHSRITGNQAPRGSGAGLFISNGNVTLTDIKVKDNIAGTAPGGVDNNDTVNTYGKVIIIDNVPTNCDGSTNPVPGCFG